MRIRRFNERREEEEEELHTSPIKGPDKQDVSHWEIVVEHGFPYLKISTDDDTYYIEVKNSKSHGYRFFDDGEEGD